MVSLCDDVNTFTDLPGSSSSVVRVSLQIILSILFYPMDYLRNSRPNISPAWPVRSQHTNTIGSSIITPQNWSLGVIVHNLVLQSRLDLLGTPGFRPIGLSPGSWQTSLGLGSMSGYSEQISICISIILWSIAYRVVRAKPDVHKTGFRLRTIYTALSGWVYICRFTYLVVADCNVEI